MEGKPVAGMIYDEVERLVAYVKKRDRAICLAVIMVGDDPASRIYVENKEKACKKYGIENRSILLSASYDERKVLSYIHELNRDKSVDGILCQMPMPAHINSWKVIQAIDPMKDVDRFHPYNRGYLAVAPASEEYFYSGPCTPQGIMQMLRYYDVATDGAHAVILGRSQLVGAPLAVMLSKPGVDATVTLCHSHTTRLAEICRTADILIAAVGSPGFVKPEWISEGTAVVDVGISRVPDARSKTGYRVVGDVDPACADRCAKLSPVPGGVGPLTIANLLFNTIVAKFWRDKALYHTVFPRKQIIHAPTESDS